MDVFDERVPSGQINGYRAEVVPPELAGVLRSKQQQTRTL
ncbi:hypothetical Protein YC6258_05190 [Gynuella sunshinyii YC6258]|uniref:Uncharacterized protein n=1 Tax=Gynuella sunshinyii YC6258 TaxID=1445510 RepID=A0A0C5VD12_9GAMM|nr:hypothetical Protein YC6258_05190 [Gynuella sunshinyii YC6258]